MNTYVDDFFTQQFAKERLSNHRKRMLENLYHNLDKTKTIYEDLKRLTGEIEDLDIKDKLLDKLWDLVEVRSSLVDLKELISEESLR